MRQAGHAPVRGAAGRRDRARLVRFAPAELEIVSARAREAGRPVASFLRETAMGVTPRPRPHAVEDGVLRELAAAASSLDALARGNPGGAPADARAIASARDLVLGVLRRLDHDDAP